MGPRSGRVPLHVCRDLCGQFVESEAAHLHYDLNIPTTRLFTAPGWARQRGLAHTQSRAAKSSTVDTRGSLCVCVLTSDVGQEGGLEVRQAVCREFSYCLGAPQHQQRQDISVAHPPPPRGNPPGPAPAALWRRRRCLCLGQCLSQCSKPAAAIAIAHGHCPWPASQTRYLHRHYSRAGSAPSHAPSLARGRLAPWQPMRHGTSRLAQQRF